MAAATPFHPPRWLACALALGCAGAPHAGAGPLEAYLGESRYQSVDGKSTGTIRLLRNADGLHRYEMTLRHGQLAAKQSTEFRLDGDGGLVPLRYRSRYRWLLFGRAESVDFDRAAGVISGRGKQGAWSVPWPRLSQVVDPLLAQVAGRQIACAAATPERSSLLLARRGAIVRYWWIRRAAETLDTVLGPLRALRYSLERADRVSRRQNWWWYAPDRNCLLLRFVHQDSNGKLRRFDLAPEADRAPATERRPARPR